MDKISTVLQIIMPIATAIFLGAIARKNKVLGKDEVKGLKQYVMKFGLPCGHFMQGKIFSFSQFSDVIFSPGKRNAWNFAFPSKCSYSI